MELLFITNQIENDYTVIDIKSTKN